MTMEWPETEETTNTDRSSISSITSNSDMVGITNDKTNNDNSNGCSTNHLNGTTVTHNDSLSDEELSDFSLNFSDDEEYKTNSSSHRK